MAGHGGGDYYLMQHFIAPFAPTIRAVLAGPAEALESHLMVFAAERARREAAVIALNGA